MQRHRVQWLWQALIFTLSLTCAEAAPVQEPTGKPFDLQAYVDREIQAGKKRIAVPAGRYRVTPRNGQHLVLHGLKDVQLRADGVELICTETTRALTISYYTNVLVRGLVVDFDPLPFTQGRIVKLTPDKKIADVELFDGYPPADAARNVGLEIFRPDTRVLRCSDRYVEKIETGGSPPPASEHARRTR